MQIPAATTQPDKSFIRPSPAFNKAVKRSLVAISLFIAVYIVLLVTALAFAVVLGAAGVFLVMAKVHWITVMLCLVFVATGILLIYFLIKFIFKRHTDDNEGRYEITEAEQPELFAFIKEVAAEVGTDFPKHVYLSPEVNASVSYNSSFWSMFLPVRKNLTIGLGLINTFNVSQLRSVLAHEFGHFSQRSMRFGSYVYNMNKVIYNMLYDNESFERMLGKLLDISSYFRITVWLNVKVITGIQWILKKVHVYLNKTHMNLSRQMEFHADAIEAYTCGANNWRDASRRLYIGSINYQVLLDYWTNELKNKKKSANFYPQHSELVKLFAEQKGMALDENGLPVVDNAMPYMNNQQVIIADQWASHPTNEEREAAVSVIPIIKPVDNRPAWLLFRSPETIQQHFTQHLYEHIEDAANCKTIGIEQFKTDYQIVVDANNFNPAYKGYYNSRIVTEFDIDEAVKEAENSEHIPLSALLSDDKINLPELASAISVDLTTLQNLIDQGDEAEIKTFDFRGEKYEHTRATEVKAILQDELKQIEDQLKTADRQVFITCYQAATSAADKQKLIEDYRKMFRYQTEHDADFDNYISLINKLRPVYQTMPYEEIDKTLKEVYNVEPEFKARLTAIINDEEYKPCITAEQRQTIDEYLSKNWIYFNRPDYDNEAINKIESALSAYASVCIERLFQHKKDLFNYQYQLAGTVTAQAI